MKIGMMFPGQGSQFPGMGKEFYDTQRIFQEYFEQASLCLEQNFVRLCFASSERDLRETINAQTSIFLLSASFYTLLRDKYGIVPDIVAGHSSGEYAAIFAAGGISFADGLYLLKKRAQFMDEATRQFPGTMMAVMGVEYEKIKKICDRYDDPDDVIQVAEVVNYNTPEQFVISGTVPELEKIAEKVREIKGKVIPLNVAGAFHSRLMHDAEKLFAQYMAKVDFKDLSVPLVNNVRSSLVQSNEQIKESLVRQMSGHVLWWPSMKYFEDCDVIIQVGPGQALAKMLKKQWKEKEIIALNTVADLEIIVQRCGKIFDPEDYKPDQELIIPELEGRDLMPEDHVSESHTDNETKPEILEQEDTTPGEKE